MQNLLSNLGSKTINQILSAVLRMAIVAIDTVHNMVLGVSLVCSANGDSFFLFKGTFHNAEQICWVQLL